MRINQNQNKYSFQQLTQDEMYLLLRGVEEFEQELRELMIVSMREINYLHWSISVDLTARFRKKTIALTVPKHYGFAVQLHELFALHRALLIYQNNAQNSYEIALCRDFIMNINPHLPRTDSTREVKLLSEL